MAFADTPDCHAARAQVLGAAPRTQHSERIVMARCRYVLVKGPPDREDGTAEWRSADHYGW